jgi:hypothetical protein
VTLVVLVAFIGFPLLSTAVSVAFGYLMARLHRRRALERAAAQRYVPSYGASVVEQTAQSAYQQAVHDVTMVVIEAWNASRARQGKHALASAINRESWSEATERLERTSRELDKANAPWRLLVDRTASISGPVEGALLTDLVRAVPAKESDTARLDPQRMTDEDRFVLARVVDDAPGVSSLELATQWMTGSDRQTRLRAARRLVEDLDDVSPDARPERLARLMDTLQPVLDRPRLARQSVLELESARLKSTQAADHAQLRLAIALYEDNLPNSSLKLAGVAPQSSSTRVGVVVGAVAVAVCAAVWGLAAVLFGSLLFL